MTSSIPKFPSVLINILFSQLDIVFPESSNYTLFHIEVEVETRNATQKNFSLGA